jgi:hypothetical protein
MKVTVDDEALGEEMKSFGLPDSKLNEVKQILKDNRKFILKSYKQWSNEVDGAILDAEFENTRDSSVLDDLLDGNVDDDSESVSSETSDGRAMRQAALSFVKPVSEAEIDDSDFSSEAAEVMKEILKNPELLKRLSENENLDDDAICEILGSMDDAEEEPPTDPANSTDEEESLKRSESEVEELFGPVDVGVRKGSSEWESVFNKYIPQPRTELERLRNRFLAQMEYSGDTPADLTTEAQLKDYQNARVEAEVMVRARLTVLYERKEAARREEDTQKRQLMFDELPALQAPIINPDVEK